MVIKQHLDNIWLAEFDNATELSLTMMRVQHCYDSKNPHFRENTFSHEDVILWYADQNKGLSVLDRETVFNYPASYLKRLKRKFRGLWSKETGFYNACKQTGVNFNYDYIIGYVKGGDKTITHELAHALYYTDEVYKDTADKFLKTIPTALRNKMKKALRDMGYDKTFLNDELQAFLVDGHFVFNKYLTKREIAWVEAKADDMFDEFIMHEEKITA